MKRGSLVGPLLIIAVGVWFLVGSLRPELPMLDVAAKFWPFLLIAWGALRLLEILSLAARRRPLPAAGISGGEWTLIVFVALIGSGLFVATQHRAWQRLPFVRINKLEMFGHGYDFSIAEQKAPAARVTRILVENLRGNTRIVGGDVTEISASGRKAVRALDEAAADRANRQTPVEVAAQGEQVVIRTNQDRITGEERVSADLDVVVPRAVSVEVRGRTGDLEITGIGGGVEVSSDAADVRLQNIGGNVRLDVRKADMIRATDLKGALDVIGGRGRDLELENIAGPVTLSGAYSGDLQFRNLAGGVRVQSPQTEMRVEKIPGQLHMDLGDVTGANLVGPIRLTTNRSRDVHLEEFTESLELALERGDVILRPVHPARIDARTRFGEIELALPESAKFELKGRTEHGELINEFGDAIKVDSSDDPGRGGSMEGRTGPGPTITLTAERGRITVRKDDGRMPVASQDRPDHPEPPPHPPRPPREIRGRRY